MEFKVGDKVLVKRTWMDDVISEVTEVTSAGNVRVKGEKGLFNKEGWHKPASYRTHLIQHLDEAEYEHKKQERDIIGKCRELAQYLTKLDEMPTKYIAKLITELHKEIKEVSDEKADGTL